MNKLWAKPFARLTIILVALHLVALAAGVGTGVVLSRDIPGIRNLDALSLPQVTQLFDRDDEPLHSFGVQRRRPVPLSEISPLYLDAVVATEDPRFEGHFGVDPIAVARAVLKTIRTGDFGVEGASTITMQLARDQFLHRSKTMRRKVQEAILATQIEKHYSKDDILELYANRIYLGHGRYGVEAASLFYFGKPSRELDLPESALLAGLAQRPEALTPVRHPERAKRRRDHVLERMRIEGYLDVETMRAAQAAPIEVVERKPEPPFAPYFIEQVRRDLLERFGEEGLYEQGLVVRTTLDPVLQRAAERAIAHGLDLYGRRHGEVPEGRPLAEDDDPETYRDPHWSEPLEPGVIVPGLVLALEDEGARAILRVGSHEVTLAREQVAWTKARRPGELLEVDTLVPLRVLAVDEEGAPSEVELASDTEAQASLVAIDVATGEVLALVGGRDFRESEFDRAVQANRQAGSAFKPFIYAAALEQGFLPTDLIPDVPTVVVDAGSPEPYQPENYERDYLGHVTMRDALEHSRNIPTLRLLDAIGYDPAVEISRRLGIASDLRAFPSLSLGAFEVTLIDLVAAYGSFVNGGVLVTPRLVREVRERGGETLLETSPETREVLAPEVAAMVTSMLEGTVQRGTGRGAKVLRRPLGGKTGTTDDFTNAWFVGFSPSIAVGVWVGHDQNSQTLGRRETGARAALPIWIRFFDEGLGPPSPESPPEEFMHPPGTNRVLVDQDSGLRPGAPSICGQPILELLPVGREPQQSCARREQRLLELPYPLQGYELDEELRIALPPEEAARMVAAADGRLELLDGRTLRYDWPVHEGRLNGRVAVDWTQADWQRFLFALPLAVERERLRALERAQFLEDIAEMDVPPDEPPPDPERLMPAHLRDGLDGFPAEILEANRSGAPRELPTPFEEGVRR